MKRRAFMGSASLATVAAGMAPWFGQKKRRPNLLFVFSDQHSNDMVGYNGHSVKTPNLDAFAKESVVLDNCFSVSPLCTPMRGALLSGQYPLRNGAYDNNIRMQEGHGTYFAETLKQRGYKTGYVGKWHLYGGYWYQPIPAGPFRYGFDDLFLSNNCDLNYLPENAYYYDQNTGERIKFGEWEQDGQTRQAMEFLDGVDSEEPFALFLSIHAPHNHRTRSKDHDYAYTAPKKFMDMYDFEKIQVREGVEPTEQNRRMQYGYEALISSVDDCFGRLMQKLEERGLAENTIVVYTSDHGDMLRYEGDKLFVKSRAEAESSNVPCMIRMPGGLPSGMRNDVMFGTLDFMPTLLSLMGISAPKEAEGTDLSSALRTGDAEFQDSVPMMLSASDQWRGVATRDWIYSYNPFVENPPTVERLNVLYNRKNDPSCRTNLFNDPKYADVQKRMHELTLKWQGKFEDPFMPYEKLIAETLDLSEFKEGQYIDFFKKSARGILKANPLDVSKNWARGGK